MVKTSKKGQAALEFLTTYGWALMVMGVVLGAFSYLISVDAFISDTCYVDGEFSCEAYALKNEQLKVKLKNLAGEPIDVNTGNLGLECAFEDGDLTGFNNGPIGVVGVGDSVDLVCDLGGMIKNKKNKVVYTVIYKKASKSFNSTAEGYVVTNHE